ncbi:MAG: hypothetical protein K0R40_821 [Burkholderiales bacterium]|nr:hypothetical protein [Burkholderiales bacterium]
MRLAAGIGLGLMLAVVVAAAAIRLEIGVGWLRPVHRVTASLEVLVVAWLAWLAWRRPAVLVAVALTVLLSIVGILAGQNPPPAAAAVNLLGGLSLAAVFAWILAEKGSGPFFGKRVLTLFLVIQVCLGAWLALVDPWSVALPIHGLLAMALTALLLWVSRANPVLFALALAAPLAGFTLLHYDSSALAALVHAAAAAFLLAGVAYAWGRSA